MFQCLFSKTSYGRWSTNPRATYCRQIQKTASNAVSRAHGHTIKFGTIGDTYTANKILNEYAKCREMIHARKLFDEIPHRDIVSWNSMIAGYVNCGSYETSWGLLKSLKRDGFGFDQYTLGSVLKAIGCRNRVDLGLQIHSTIFKSGLDRNVFSGCALLDMYAKCKRIENAKLVFEFMPERNVVAWNAMIAGYAQAGDCMIAFYLFDQMEKGGSWPDKATFASLLTLLDGPEFYKLTSQIHGKIIKRGRASETIAYNATITAYSECSSIGDSEKMFNNMEEARDLVTWNSMLAAYAYHNLGVHAIELFVKMRRLGIEQDMYTYTSTISACIEEYQQRQGKSLHGLVIKTGLDTMTPVSNSLIVMYLRSNKRSMEDALKLFNLMDFKDSVSWNSILTGFSQSGLSEDALKFFGRMITTYIEIDHYAFSAALRCCSDLATLQLGRQIHGIVLKLGFGLNDFVASSLVFMYSKCGVIEDASRSFEETHKDSSVIWNSIIFGHAQHGHGKFALDLFSQMQERHVKPDHITFVGVLSACSHVGLVEEGLNFLKSMESSYGIPLRMEHYACGVDLLGRAGHLDEAKALIASMPFEPDAMVWKTLLGACRSHGDLELASYTAKLMLRLEPKDHSTYILLSDIYAGFGRWDERAMIKRVMREKGLRKVPGWSWIEVKNKVHAFNAEDRSHPQAEDIYKRLEELMMEIRRLGYVANVEFAMHDLDCEKRDCD